MICFMLAASIEYSLSMDFILSFILFLSIYILFLFPFSCILSLTCFSFEYCLLFFSKEHLSSWRVFIEFLLLLSFLESMVRMDLILKSCMESAEELLYLSRLDFCLDKLNFVDVLSSPLFAISFGNYSFRYLFFFLFSSSSNKTLLGLL